MQVRWSDVDLFAHVNNAAYLRYLDDARFELFPTMGVDADGRPTDSMMVVVKHEIDYVAPLTFRATPFVVEVWVPRVGRSSVDFAYEIVDARAPGAHDGAASPAAPADGPRRVYLRARSRMVQLDRDGRSSRPFSDEERAVFTAFPGDPTDLRPW